MILDPADLFTNAGTIRASGGGIISLRDGGAGDFANSGGVIEALEESEIQFSNNSRVVGGVLQSAGTGVIRNTASQDAELVDLTLDGTFVAENNSDTRITGTINNTGSITINSTGNATDLELGIGGATLTGGGTVTLSGTNARINDINGTQTLTIENQTIQGEGNFGVNTIDIVNGAGGTITANMPGDVLRIDYASPLINHGTIRASNGGLVEIASGLDTLDGTIEAIGAGSKVELITGDYSPPHFNPESTIRAIDGGVVNLTNTTAVEIDLVSNGGFLEFTGTSNTDLFNDALPAGVLPKIGPSTAGNLRSNAFALNSGTFRIGDGLNFTSLLTNATFTNSGTIVVGNNSLFSGGGQNGGIITGEGGGEVFLLNSYVPFISTGTLAGSGQIANTTTVMTGTGVGSNYLESDGFIKPGDNPGETGTLTLVAYDIFLGDSNVVEIELGDGEHDVLDLITGGDGPVALNCELDVSFLAGYDPSVGDSFDIITAINGLTGTFDTETLPMHSSGLEWLLSYAANTVTLEVLLTGDFEEDGDVNGADFLSWQRGFGTIYDAGDLADWQANYGTTPNPLSASANVPEPSTVLLSLLALTVLGVRSRHIAWLF